MLMKIIALENLNSLVVNNRVNAAAVKIGLQSNEENVRLVKVMLRESKKAKVPTGVPLYAFVKNFKFNGNNVIAVYDIASGKLQFVNDTFIASETDVKGRFTIGPVTYGLLDTVNGAKRYHPICVSQRRPRRNKIIQPMMGLFFLAVFLPTHVSWPNNCFALEPKSELQIKREEEDSDDDNTDITKPFKAIKTHKAKDSARTSVRYNRRGLRNK